MAGISTGVKKKLTISPCTIDSSGDIKIDSFKKNFELMLNPSEFSHEHSISYSDSNSGCDQSKSPLGRSALEPKFNVYEPEKVSFNLVIDGTGVVNLPVSGKGSQDVKTQVQNLKNIVYKYDGNTHEPSVVRLLWGSFIFYGRLTSMSVNYTLFKPSGEPLRAKITLSFTRYMSNKEEALRANRSSPDLTHIIEVKAGDTLPLLCYRVYKDCSYYLEVARVNNITNFREINAGDKLHFPPLT
jgi:hypothetical protein